MIKHSIKVFPSSENLPKENQLAYKLAKVATNYEVDLDQKAIDMVVNRIIDNAGVAIASINRKPVVSARLQALAHDKVKGASIFGTNLKVHAEWAAWANATAIRELDYHDTFLAEDYAHPADSIPAILSVAEQKGCNGEDIIRGILAAYEVHVALVKSICLHKHKIDHVAHLCPAQAAGICALLKLDTETCYQAIQQAFHTSISTRQSRKGVISSWKAYVPAHGAKLAIEAVDRAMRGEQSPSPIYEGEDSVIAWILDGKNAHYEIELPDVNESKKAILETYTKAHSAEYQSQALIDLAFELRNEIDDLNNISKITIETSHHTHYVIGTGANDPQKLDPLATRETLDHSIMYIFAVALQDGMWHHISSYASERAARTDTIKLWHKIETIEKDKWTQLYHHTDPKKKAFGGKVIVAMENGVMHEKELERAHAHSGGKNPFDRKQYINKFKTLTRPFISEDTQSKFINCVQELQSLTKEQIVELNIEIRNEDLIGNKPDQNGIF